MGIMHNVINMTEDTGDKILNLAGTGNSPMVFLTRASVTE